MTAKEENKWIEQRFNCNITMPLFDEDQLELLEAGFPVTPNFTLPPVSDSYQKILNDCVDEMLQIQSESGTKNAVETIMNRSSLNTYKNPKNSHRKPSAQKKNGSDGNCETKEIKNNGNQPNDLNVPVKEFNQRFNSYETAPF